MRWDQSSQKSGEEGRCCPRPRPCGCCCRGPQGEQGPQGEREPQGETGQPGKNSVLAVASFFAFERRFENGKPIPLVTGMADETGQIRLVDETRIQLEQGRYAVWYTVSAVLEKGVFSGYPIATGKPTACLWGLCQNRCPACNGGWRQFSVADRHGAHGAAIALQQQCDQPFRGGIGNGMEAGGVILWQSAA